MTLFWVFSNGFVLGFPTPSLQTHETFIVQLQTHEISRYETFIVQPLDYKPMKLADGGLSSSNPMITNPWSKLVDVGLSSSNPLITNPLDQPLDYKPIIKISTFIV